MVRRLRAIQMAEAMAVEFEGPHGLSKARRAFENKPGKTIAKWAGLDREASKKVISMPEAGQDILNYLVNTILAQTEQIQAYENKSATRGVILRTFLNSMNMTVITIIDWILAGSGGDIPAGEQSAGKMTCLDAEIAEMIAEMDLEDRANELAQCLAAAVISSLPGPVPGPLGVPPVTDCYNDMISFNFASRHLAKATALRRILCNPSGGV